MSNFTKKQKLELLKRGLKRRIDGLEGAVAERQKNIDTIKGKRVELTSRIEKYKDDELITTLLKAQLTEFDRQYTNQNAIFQTAIDEIRQSAPKVERLYELLDNLNNKEKELVLLFLDLFFKETLIDWNDLELQMKKKLEEQPKKERLA